MGEVAEDQRQRRSQKILGRVQEQELVGSEPVEIALKADRAIKVEKVG